MIAKAANGYLRSVAIAVANEVLPLILAAFKSLATNSGSGRRPNQKTDVAAICERIVNKNGPVIGGRCSAWPTISPGPNMFGPITAPKVVAQTTTDRSRPVERFEGKSVAANRACRPTAEPAPSKNSAIRSSGNHSTIAEVITKTAPVIAKAAPVASATRRPRAKASRASGIAQLAAPRVLKVAADPAQAGEPDRWAANNEPIDSVEPSPNPDNT